MPTIATTPAQCEQSTDPTIKQITGTWQCSVHNANGNPGSTAAGTGAPALEQNNTTHDVYTLRNGLNNYLDTPTMSVTGNGVRDYNATGSATTPVQDNNLFGELNVVAGSTPFNYTDSQTAQPYGTARIYSAASVNNSNQYFTLNRIANEQTGYDFSQTLSGQAKQHFAAVPASKIQFGTYYNNVNQNSTASQSKGIGYSVNFNQASQDASTPFVMTWDGKFNAQFAIPVISVGNVVINGDGSITSSVTIKRAWEQVGMTACGTSQATSTAKAQSGGLLVTSNPAAVERSVNTQ